jgi:hypothetical protein
MCRLLVIVVAVFTSLVSFTYAEDDTPHAAFTRKLFKAKVSVECKDVPLSEFLDQTLRLATFRAPAAEIFGKPKSTGLIGLGPIFEPTIIFKPDTKSGVKLDAKVTVSVKDTPVEDVVNKLCDKNGWGYYVISNSKSFDDGKVVLKVGKERGYEKGKEPAGKDEKAANKGKDTAKNNKETQGKIDADERARPKESPLDDDERAATLKLRTAKELVGVDKKERAKQVLEDLLAKYPKSKAAEEAKELLENLK